MPHRNRRAQAALDELQVRAADMASASDALRVLALALDEAQAALATLRDGIRAAQAKATGAKAYMQTLRRMAAKVR